MNGKQCTVVEAKQVPSIQNASLETAEAVQDVTEKPKARKGKK